MASNIQSDEEQGPTARLLQPARRPFTIEVQIKSVPSKKKLKKFVTTKPALQVTIKGVFKKKKENKEEE